MPPPSWSLDPTAGPGWNWGGPVAVTEGSYRELNARVPVSTAGPLAARLVGAVAGPSPPPPAQHVAARPLPCCQSRERAPVAPRFPPAPPPRRGSLTPEGCGLGLPARFFFEMEGVFMSSRFFLENMVRPAQQPRPVG